MRDYTEDQLERYSRHILLKDVGIEGQEKLLDGRVLIIGAGGLGSPAALYLAAAGVGTIGIVDGDKVDVSNLQRQIAHFTKDVGVWKSDSASEKMRAINPDVKVVTYNKYLFASNIREVIREYDFVIDGTDNFAAKFLINDACIFENIPFSHGGILRFEGQTITVNPNESACIRCLFDRPPPPGLVPSCAEAGVLGAIAGMLGTIQTTEALKFLTGAGELLNDKLLFFNALEMEFKTISVKKNKNCPICGEQPSITELVDGEQEVCDIKGH